MASEQGQDLHPSMVDLTQFRSILASTLAAVVTTLTVTPATASGPPKRFPPRSFCFEFDGRDRCFVLKLPTGYRSSTPLPLVISMHGLGGTGEEHRVTTGFDQVADEQNFIVAFPDGVNNRWASGDSESENVDDVGFISALIDVLAANLSVDLRRVYTTGFSNGGFMSYRLACELENRIAAIGSVAGLIDNEVFESCAPSRPVPVIHIHGTRDRIVPYTGALNFFPGVNELLIFWGQQNGCVPPVNREDLPDRVTADNSTVTRLWVETCRDNTAVELLRINNGGHTWPGSTPFPLVGPTNQDIDASEEQAKFFRRHQLPAELIQASPPGPGDRPPVSLEIFGEGELEYEAEFPASLL